MNAIHRLYRLPSPYELANQSSSNREFPDSHRQLTHRRVPLFRDHQWTQHNKFLCLLWLRCAADGKFNHSPRPFKLLRKYPRNVWNKKVLCERKKIENKRMAEEEKVLVSEREAIAKSSNQIPSPMHFHDNHNGDDCSH
ncbi:hypothetical protein CDAR_452441 [Caerostris darwini]|uniref:Uncharacterized protein n=1 Tax=Caerostris darwini TaxID=1538125 RepID=A0AAV4ULD3_9ARAC|nr:hypothetical protein CDAR_452441 [Caerostris darwini]